MISIVTTLYSSAPYINAFYTRTSTTAQKLCGTDYELIFVNDGSPDNSLELVLQIAQQDAHVVVVDLSKNFGHHNAMLTGIARACGECIFLIDVDLEESPEWLLDFDIEMKSGQYDVVYGVQDKRKGGRFEQFSGGLFYKTFRLLSGVDLPDNIMTARLMSRRYVHALLSHSEKDIFLGGLMHITGFAQKPLTLTKVSKGSSSYTLKKKLSLLVKAVTSFSSMPLVYVFYIGLLVFLVSIFLGMFVLCKYLLGGVSVSGWVSVMLSIWFLGGLVLMAIGIVGIYISKIFIEVKSRPVSIIRSVYRKEQT